MRVGTGGGIFWYCGYQNSGYVFRDGLTRPWKGLRRISSSRWRLNSKRYNNCNRFWKHSKQAHERRATHRRDVTQPAMHPKPLSLCLNQTHPSPAPRARRRADAGLLSAGRGVFCPRGASSQTAASCSAVVLPSRSPTSREGEANGVVALCVALRRRCRVHHGSSTVSVVGQECPAYARVSVQTRN